MAQLNWDMKFAMEQAADDAELFKELLEIFKQSCDTDIRAIKEGIENDNPKQVYGAAHSMKGAAASLGATMIHDIALTIERDSREGSLSVAKIQYERLAALIDELQKI